MASVMRLGGGACRLEKIQEDGRRMAQSLTTMYFCDLASASESRDAIFAVYSNGWALAEVGPTACSQPFTTQADTGMEPFPCL